jgi:hypothetical protein
MKIIEKWLKKWKIKVKETKSSHITFTSPERTLSCSQHQPNHHTSNRSSKIPRTTLRLQVELERAHRQEKETNRLQKHKRSTGWKEKKSHLSTENKLLIYKAVIKPIWSYGIELWGCASKSNTVIMHRSKSKILTAIANALRYVTNHTVHTDFNIPYVSDVIHEIINKQHNKLEAHPNPLLQPVLQLINTRRKKRCRPLDLQGT